MPRMLALIVLLLLTTAQSVQAGKLDDFERDATRNREEKKESNDSSANSADSSILGVLLNAVISGSSTNDRSNDPHPLSGPDMEKLFGQHLPGVALLPVVRLDLAYQAVESDVAALDLRGEIGYAMLGLAIRNTHYWEKEPRNQLNVAQLHALARIPVADPLEFDIGLGSLFLAGDKTYSGFSFTTPLLYHPSEHFGVEFRPVWSNLEGSTIQDYDLAMFLGWRYASLKAGYRWFLSNNASLNGPELGVALRW